MTKSLQLRIDQPILELQNELGESPLWDLDEQALYWLDIERGQVHWYEIETKDHQVIDLDEKAGCIAFTQRGDLLVATANGLAIWNDMEGLGKNVLEFFSPTDPRMMNDGKVGPAGNFWVGSKGPKNASRLYRVSPGFACETMIDELTISNGLDWTPQSDHFLLTDLGVETVYRYKYCADTGSISDKETFFVAHKGTPDGLTIDAEGNVWIAIWDAGQVVGLKPSGEQFCQIDLPISRPTSVAFGGPDMNTLFITSARTGLSAVALKREPLAGSLFAINLKSTGRPCNKFAY